MPSDIIYIILPVEIAGLYISCDYSFARLSVDESLLVWGQVFDQNIFDKIVSDSRVSIFSYDDILNILNGDVWSVPLDR